MCLIYLLKENFVVEQVFKKFHFTIHNQFQEKIQILHTDNGKKYFNSILGQYLSQNENIH